MKKILLILMLILGSLSFAEKTVIFSGETKKGKIVKVLKDEEKEGCYYYSYGKKGKPEIIIRCIDGETLFTDFGNFAQQAYVYTLRFINPQAKDYSYQIKKVVSNNEYYKLEVFKKGELIFDILFKTESIKGELPDYNDITYENEEDREIYMSY
ncbi:hypothetical protein KST23_03390 [Fusobacterium nucleatum]|uniref:hypothetical protein n=1 Tax=Fusobacterium nucleatum TaxID=851 RepID=UPI003D0683A9